MKKPPHKKKLNGFGKPDIYMAKRIVPLER